PRLPEALDGDRDEAPFGDQRVDRLPPIGRAPGAERDLGLPAGGEEAVRAEARQEPVAKRVLGRNLAREELGREQALEEIVVAGVAFAPGDPDSADLEERLDEQTSRLGRPPAARQNVTDPRREVRRRERAFGAERFEDVVDLARVRVEER